MDQKGLLNKVINHGFKIEATLVKSRYGSGSEVITISGKVGEKIALQMLETWRGETEPTEPAEVFGSEALIEVQDENLVLIHGGQVRILCGLKQINSIIYYLSDEIWGECFSERVYSEKSVVRKDRGFGSDEFCPECDTLFPNGMRECECGWKGVTRDDYCSECREILPHHWSPKCDCGWAEYNENQYVVVLHWTDESITVHEDFPTLEKMTEPLSGINFMPKNEILLGVMERLEYILYYKVGLDENGRSIVRNIRSLQSGQSNEAYASQVWLWDDKEQKTKECGSWLNWDRDGSWTEGDGCAVWLEIQEEKIVLCRNRYKDRGDKPNETQIVKIICNVSDIVKMWFETTSGWSGECYPVGETVPEEGESALNKKWGTIWHRSTGAVTFIDFPFEIIALRPEPEWKREGYVPISERRAQEEGAVLESTASEESGEYIIEDSDEIVRQVEYVWQHKHESYDYWHPVARVHK